MLNVRQAPPLLIHRYRTVKSLRAVWPVRLRQTILQCQNFSSSPCDAQVIFSGIQPTGVAHLGNYLGALKQWVRLQNEAGAGTRLLYSIVDLHAITSQQSADQLRQRKRETIATLLAVGLDPNRCTIFYQSTVRSSGCSF